MFVVFAKKLLQQIQASIPEALVEAQPFLGARQRSGIEAAYMRAAANLSADEAGIFKRLDMFGRRGERNLKGFRELSYSSFAVRQRAQHPSSGSVAEGVKNRVEFQCS
ncbi:hypothetical protein ASE04_13420 [Rhizobium sp. Root708]|nr:hypothetical protein ASE04_13420 [Rhizobium sp. Root708]